jgi:CRISPR/Cas system CSM-associated protein Csm5 (group 7 of RAMP superfamily)
MILIYTGAVREILTNFCIDERYNDDTWKDEWVNFIHKNQGDPEADPPEPYFKDGSTENINEKTVDWINQAVETISNLKLKQYENKTLMELVVEMNKNVTDFRVED